MKETVMSLFSSVTMASASPCDSFCWCWIPVPTGSRHRHTHWESRGALSRSRGSGRQSPSWREVAVGMHRSPCGQSQWYSLIHWSRFESAGAAPDSWVLFWLSLWTGSYYPSLPFSSSSWLSLGLPPATGATLAGLLDSRGHAPNTFLAEEVAAWRPRLWCFQEFLGGPCPEVEANCSRGTISPRNDCIGSTQSHWRSPDGWPHSPPIVLGAGESSGTWRPPLPAT